MPTGGTAQALSSSVRSGRWAVDGAEGPRGHLNHLHKEEKKKKKQELRVLTLVALSCDISGRIGRAL